MDQPQIKRMKIWQRFAMAFARFAPAIPWLFAIAWSLQPTRLCCTCLDCSSTSGS